MSKESMAVWCAYGEILVSIGDEFISTSESTQGRWRVDSFSPVRFVSKWDPRGDPDIVCRNLGDSTVRGFRGDTVASLIAVQKAGEELKELAKPKPHLYLFKCDIYAQRPHDVILVGCYTAEVEAASPAGAILAGCDGCRKSKGGGYLALHPQVWAF